MYLYEDQLWQNIIENHQGELLFKEVHLGFLWQILEAREERCAQPLFFLPVLCVGNTARTSMKFAVVGWRGGGGLPL